MNLHFRNKTEPNCSEKAIPENAPEKRRAWILVLGLFVLTLGIYWFPIGLLKEARTPTTAYVNFLANAFLHGRLHLLKPPAVQDLTHYQGKWYVPFPPLGALLLIPWVSISGPSRVNTVFYAAVLGAANTAEVFLLLQALAHKNFTQLSRADNLWLTALWGIGSVQWYMSTQGSVWFISQLCAATFVLLATWSAVTNKAPCLVGIWIAVAMLGRPNAILCFPLVLGIGFQNISRAFGIRKFRRWALWGVQLFLPVSIGVILLLGYNYARFHSLLDFGYVTENVAPQLKQDLQTHGQFDLSYVPHNLWAMLLAGPGWDPATRVIVPNQEGMSLLLTTPALLYLIKAKKKTLITMGAWAALGLLLVPLLTYYNTGWVQFGYRFSLDFMTPVLVLLAIGAGTRVGWSMRVAILIGVIVNAWGTWWFNTL